MTLACGERLDEAKSAAGIILSVMRSQSVTPRQRMDTASAEGTGQEMPGRANDLTVIPDSFWQLPEVTAAVHRGCRLGSRAHARQTPRAGSPTMGPWHARIRPPAWSQPRPNV